MPEAVQVENDPAAQPVVEQTETPGAPDPAAPAEGEAPAGEEGTEGEAPAAAAEGEAPASEVVKKKPWFQARIDKLTAKNTALQTQLEQRLVQAPADPAAPQGGKQPVNAEAVRIATQMLAQERFNERCNDLVDDGKEKFGPEFDTSLANMKAVGAVGPDADPTFINAVLELKDPSKVFHALGKDPDETARILALSPTRQVIELARLEEKMNKPKPVVISKAPAPITPVGGAAKSDPDLNDEDLPMEQWVAQRDKTRRTRQ